MPIFLQFLQDQQSSVHSSHDSSVCGAPGFAEDLALPGKYNKYITPLTFVFKLFSHFDKHTFTGLQYIWKITITHSVSSFWEVFFQ